MLPDGRTDALSRLIYELSKLPGIGEKSAGRLAYHILKQGPEFARVLSDAILNAKQSIVQCRECFVLTDQELCGICANSQRASNLLCLVERPSDVRSIEATGSFRGKYHVLHGVLSPLDGIGPEDLKIRELLQRIQFSDHSVQEVLLALNPSVEGDATGLYLAKLLQPLGVRVTKLAHGIPVGGQIEYSDRQTIGRAIENRMELRL